MKIDLFGKVIEVEKTKDGWKVFYQNTEGKRYPADDLVIPSSLREDEIVRYLDDLCHEKATEKHQCVRVLS